jgi:hypothetical protein
MKSLDNHVKWNLAFRAIMRALLSLCFIGLLASCDKGGAPAQTPAGQPSESNKGAGENIASQANRLFEKGTVFELLKQKPEAINGLKMRTEAIEAVKEIGERKQVEAIPSLLDAMFTIQPFFINNRGDFTGTYPCSDALIKIGEPAVPQIKDQFLVAKSGTEQLVLLHVLIKINGTLPTSEWLEEVQGMRLVPERRQRYAELKSWVLSHRN